MSSALPAATCAAGSISRMRATQSRDASTRATAPPSSRALLERSVHVTISGTDEGRLTKAAVDLRTTAGQGTQVQHVVADVRDDAAVERLMQTTVERLGGLDILI